MMVGWGERTKASGFERDDFLRERRMISTIVGELTGSELMERQVVSRKRVADHGEVYTGKREVNAMLDLVKQETERIESRFLSLPAGREISWQKFWSGN